jgi:hypothetical protein
LTIGGRIIRLPPPLSAQHHLAQATAAAGEANAVFIKIFEGDRTIQILKNLSD